MVHVTSEDDRIAALQQVPTLVILASLPLIPADPSAPLGFGQVRDLADKACACDVIPARFWRPFEWRAAQPDFPARLTDHPASAS